MTKQAQVGAFALVALAMLFGVFYVITDFGTRTTGYRVGVRFTSAAGVTPGALVYFSGVSAGSVDSIKLLPDNSVDIILAINRNIDIPSASRFLIDAPLTGTPAIVIVPPRQAPPVALLPRQVLPIDEQPHGTNAATVGDLLQESQREFKKLDRLMDTLETRTPKLLDSLQSTLNNANELSRQFLSLSSNLEGSLASASSNIVALSATLNSAATTDSSKVGTLLDRFNSTAVSLDDSMASLRTLATNPDLKANVLQTTKNIAETTQTIAALVKDLRTVTGDPQTQAQLRNAVGNLDALMQKANSLLAELGGTSSVYGIDTGASPPPPTVPSSSPYPGVQGAPAVPGASGVPASPVPGATPGGISPALKARLQTKLAQLQNDLINIQLRVSELSPQHSAGLNPVMTNSQGPLGDLNLVLLPHSSTSVIVGANSIGNNTTWNALLQANRGDFHFAGGVLYSQMGILGSYSPLHGLGLETRIYDLTYPMVDALGTFKIAPGAQLFFGQRDITHASRRNTIGLQYQF